jgi:glyoxylase-like metal-dependent hydrolase (beta-lactamase superfamily II)
VERRSRIFSALRWAAAGATRPVAVAAILLAAAGASRTAACQAPSYTIDAVRYGTIREFPVSALVMGAPSDERIDIAMVLWLIRGEGRVVLFDSGFFRSRWFERFEVDDYLRPDSALAEAGVAPGNVTDVIVSHAHWDHMGGIALFPGARVHIQREEYLYYTGPAWSEGGRHGGIDEDDVLALVERNLAGRVILLEGDDVEVLPGIRAYTGARHTYASQYVRVGGAQPFVLASDNCYLFRNLDTGSAGATFDPTDRPANEEALARMARLAGAASRVIPGHDALQFRRFPTVGRVARIRGS